MILNENEIFSSFDKNEKKLKIVNFAYLILIENLFKYIEGYTPFSTQHKVKGAEFKNVLVILDNGNWNQYNFEYGKDKEENGVVVNDKCKTLAKKIKEIIDTKSSFADWLNNQRVRDQLKLDIKICLVKNGYPPQYSPEVFNRVMEQVENFEENSDMYR